MNGYLEIEDVLRKRREQADSVKGKDTPFRVEFRYPHGTKHWQYFETIESAAKAEDSLLNYGLRGDAIIQRPLSQFIQKRGPKGGWAQAEEEK